jgi:aryl-phospho-beta-D-glucosidase BglC (GH1 family)
MGFDPKTATPGLRFGDGPFTQADFDDLARAGANYVQISHAGLFRETPPYDLDLAAQANLDSVIQMAAQAGLYAVIAYRTGPGRNETAILRDGPILESIWSSDVEQAAWAAMLRYTAQRYRDNPTIVGYDPMVEPNDYVRRNLLNPQAFYAQYAGTLDDFNTLALRVTKAVREVDQTTPILLEPDGFGGVPFLSYLKVTGDPRTVYTVHDYTPFDYTHELRPTASYPGTHDVDGSGDVYVDRAYLVTYLRAVTTYGQQRGVPVAITEWGGHRTATNIGTYIRDRVALQDPIGNWAVWTWQPAGFQDPFSVHDPSPTNTALREAWASNCVRPN